MTEATHKEIRQKMTACGVWEYAENMRVYGCYEFIKEFGKHMPDDLITLLRDHVNRLQAYCDDRIIEPTNFRY